MTLRVIIIGGGNLGHVCAARMAAKGVSVTMLTSTPDRWPSVAAAEDCEGHHFEGPMMATEDPASVADADLVVLCLPGHVLEKRLSQLAPHLHQGTPVLSVFSGDGFFFFAEAILGATWPVMGFQRVPFICRTKIPYRLGGLAGYRKELFLAHRNVSNPEMWRLFAADMCATKTTLLDNFYDAALVNSNVILHPARLMSLQSKIDANGLFTRVPLFYEEWDDEASIWAIRLDDELQAVASRMGAHLQTFLSYYESLDVVSLTRKIRSIAAFKGIGSPITASGEIDLASRFVQADIKIALAFVSQLAHANGIASGATDQVLERFS